MPRLRKPPETPEQARQNFLQAVSEIVEEIGDD